MRRFLEYGSFAFGLIGVVGVGLAIYYHAEAVKERAPAYYVSPERTRILDTSIPTPSQLQVLYRGKDLKANVSAVIVYLWNDGKLPIKAEDVLEPVRIQLDPACEILDARVMKVSRAVTKFAKGDVSETAKSSLPLSFSILERGDGAALQIIYTGKPDAKVSVLGTIIGAEEPQNFSPTVSFAASKRQPRSALRRDALIGITLGVLLICLTIIGAILKGPVSQTTSYSRRWLRKLGDFTFSPAAIFYALLMAVLAITLSVTIIRSIPAVVPSSIWTEQ